MTVQRAEQGGGAGAREEIAAGAVVTLTSEIDGAAFSIRAVVAQLARDVVWLRPSGRDPLLERLEAGQPVHLSFPRPEGPFVAASSFVSLAEGGESPLIAVEYPVGAYGVDGRVHMRLDLERRLTIESVNGAASLQGLAEARTVNLSAGGMLIASDAPLSIGDVLRVGLQLTGEGRLRVEAQVVRIYEPPAASRDTPGAYRVALRFLERPLAAQDAIVRHLYSVEREQLESLVRAV